MDVGCGDKEFKNFDWKSGWKRIDTWRLCGKKCLEDPECKVWTFYAGIRGKGKTERECKFYKTCKKHPDKAYYYRGQGRGNYFHEGICPTGDFTIL